MVRNRAVLKRSTVSRGARRLPSSPRESLRGMGLRSICRKIYRRSAMDVAIRVPPRGRQLLFQYAVVNYAVYIMIHLDGRIIFRSRRTSRSTSSTATIVVAFLSQGSVQLRTLEMRYRTHLRRSHLYWNCAGADPTARKRPRTNGGHRAVFWRGGQSPTPGRLPSSLRESLRGWGPRS